MGRAFFYCGICSRRLSEDDFARAKAVRAGDRILCRPCAESDGFVAPPAVKDTGSTRSKIVPRPIPSPAMTAAPTDRRMLLLACGAAAVVLIVGALIFLLSRSDPRPAASAPTDPVPPLPPVAVPVPESPREKAAQGALAQARALPEADLAGRASAFGELLFTWDGTAAAVAARKDLETVKAAIRADVQAGLDPLERELLDLVARKEFDGALTLLEKARGRKPYPEWALALGRRDEEVRSSRRKAAALVEPETAKVPESAKPGVSAERTAYPAAWAEAAAPASARDYGSAAAAVDRLAAGTKDVDVRREATEDAADLRAAGAALKDALESLRGRPAGTGLSIEVRDASGAPRRAGGTIVRCGADGVEIRAGAGTIIADPSELTASWLAARVPKSGARGRAVLMAFDGDLEAARKIDPSLPERYARAAELAPSRRPKPDAAETAARAAYDAAEREFASVGTRLSAVEKYRNLLADYASTSLVGARAEGLRRRIDLPRECFFIAADFATAGTFRRTAAGRVESTADSSPSEANRNTADLEFVALPATPYRCWVFVGGCCEETFAFLVQATDLVETDPKTRKKLAMDPGAGHAHETRPPIRKLAKSHAAHPQKQPKRADRWEWVEIVLPKYATPGGKKVRLMTDQAGFSIAAAVVSATRKSPPTDAELKELEKTRAAEEPVRAADPDLIAWWTFDEGAGSESADLTGKGHTVTLEGGGWEAGKFGTALKCAGAFAAGAKDAEDLRVAGDFTIALWLRKAEEVDDWARFVGKGSENCRTFGLWEWPKDDRRIKFQQAAQGKFFDIDSTRPMPIGEWTHVAASLQGDVARLYVNGEPDGEKRRDFPVQADDRPFTFGHAGHHQGFKGAIDDVRLYRRALSADEIRPLFDAGR